MDFGAILKFILFVSLGFKTQSAIKEEAMSLSNSVKVLIQSIEKPGDLTVIACWHSGCVFNLNLFRLK